MPPLLHGWKNKRFLSGVAASMQPTTWPLFSETQKHDRFVKSSFGLSEFLPSLRQTILHERATRETLQPIPGCNDPIGNLMSRVRLTRKDLDRYAHWKHKNDYARNLIATDGEHYTLVLMCWNPGCQSPIHDHPSEGCWMNVVQGSIRESRYQKKSHDKLVCFMDRVYQEKERTYITDAMGYHKIVNPSLTIPAVSLHLYCPPIAQCRVWESNDASLASTRGLSYHSEYGQLVP